ncbi:mobile mystery protein B [Synechococcus sp. BA-132 BA5]|uniref:mobile mystery protein B n=1 Tax=Synechococcus sp. BA-132 BA5 TaxID=3110252 RepID=UPI002B1EF20D|nr:mobile mystery protein B [Synechococcus sp. BA-132 BA5]MEA5414866.1 mobile mystery protein B [Synechococcus sp. BA-132 BA5]
MGLNDGLPAGATPLDGEELEGLLPTHLVNRSQLNEWEQQNIEAALLWLSQQRRPRPLEEAWLRRLHREMFGQSWRWAGHYRSSDKSIGADWRQIRMQVPALLADIAYQVEHRVEPTDQIAMRFHHRLVAIHLFPNGNGRRARLIADVLIEQLGAPPFSWGGDSSLVATTALRQQYIDALQQADRGHIGFLLAFARAR